MLIIVQMQMVFLANSHHLNRKMEPMVVEMLLKKLPG